MACGQLSGTRCFSIADKTISAEKICKGNRKRFYRKAPNRQQYPDRSFQQRSLYVQSGKYHKYPAAPAPQGAPELSAGRSGAEKCSHKYLSRPAHPPDCHQRISGAAGAGGKIPCSQPLSYHYTGPGRSADSAYRGAVPLFGHFIHKRQHGSGTGCHQYGTGRKHCGLLCCLKGAGHCPPDTNAKYKNQPQP